MSRYPVALCPGKRRPDPVASHDHVPSVRHPSSFPSQYSQGAPTTSRPIRAQLNQPLTLNINKHRLDVFVVLQLVH
jgi:hypothetical protein